MSQGTSPQEIGRWNLVAVLGILLVVGARPGASAPANEARLRGTVRDRSGTLLPGAQITARDLLSGLTRTTRSDDQGQFEIPDLRAGSYQIRVYGAGFSNPWEQNLDLESGQTATLAPRLDADAPAPAPREGTPGEGANRPSATPSPSMISESQLAGLPLNGRSYSQLATLQSGVTDTAGGSGSRGVGGGSLTVAGGRPGTNTFLLDGTNIMDTDNQAPRSAAGVQLGSDAILQVQVFSSNYGAEYGRNSGGVLNSITRSGTPEFHGTFFEYFRNSKLDTRNAFDPVSGPPPFKRNQFGFTITGPLVKDRTFFLGSFEAMRDRLNQTDVSFFPTAEARLGIGIVTDASGNPVTVPVNARVQPYLDLYPLPNDISLGRGIGRNLAPQFLPTDENFWTVRLDHKISDRDSFFARYTFDDANSNNPQDTYLFSGTTRSRQQYLTLVGTHIFSPRSLASFRLGYTRPVVAGENVAQIEVPRALYFFPTAYQFGQIRVPGLGVIGPDPNSPRQNVMNSFQFAHDTILQRGNHGLKMGMEVHRYRWDFWSYFNSGAVWSFNSLESFLQAGPVGTGLQVALPGSDNSHAWRQTLAGFYLQDEYRVRPGWQWNLSLRYEFVTVLKDRLRKSPYVEDLLRDTAIQVGPYAFANNDSLRNFAPRIGISWSPGRDRKTALNAGLGVYYDQLIGNTITNRRSSAPYYNVIANPNFDSSPFFPDALGAAAAAPVPPLIQVGDYRNTTSPMILRYNFSLQRELPVGWRFQAGYVGARGNHLIRRFEANQFPVPTTGPDGSLFFPPNAGRVNAAFGSVNLFPSDVQSFYNSFQLSVNRTLNRGLSLQTSYTYSKSVDDSSVIVDNSYAIQYGWMRTLDRGLSDFDIRHRLVFNYLYQFPFGSSRRWGKTGILFALLGNWQAGGIASIRSGIPNTPQINVRYKDYLFAATRPNLRASESKNPVEGVTSGCGSVPAGQKLGGADLYFDPCAFEAPSPGMLGNVGRNNVISPRVFNMDISLQREFFLDSKRRFQFRAEVFNLPNHTSLSGPSSSGLVVFTGETARRNPTAGRISRTATTSRQIQFALRFSF